MNRSNAYNSSEEKPVLIDGQVYIPTYRVVERDSSGSGCIRTDWNTRKEAIDYLLSSQMMEAFESVTITKTIPALHGPK